MKYSIASLLISAAMAASGQVAMAQAGPTAADQPAATPPGPPSNASEEGVTGPGGPPDSVFDDTWITIGFGAAYSPSYTGSDDYVFSALPVLQGSVGGVNIAPRPGGVALDVIPDAEEGPSFSFGPVVRLRNDRADQIEDETVKLAGELDRAIELGVSGGISFPKLLSEFDSLSIDADVRWDVAGAHEGMVIDPSITYFTPINRGTVVSLTLGASFIDDDFADYYFTVDPAAAAATGLPTFNAEGGLQSLSATTLVGIDLDGNALNGGLGAVIIGGYSRLKGDAADTPFTSVVGSKDQFFIAVGLGYTF